MIAPAEATGIPATLADLIEDAAHYLCARGWLDPDDEFIPDETVDELAALAKEGPCDSSPAPLRASALADHFLARKQELWERSIPDWTCDCGAFYKVLAEFGWCREDFYDAPDGPGGVLGDLVGFIGRNSKGRVKESGKCRACGRVFADTVKRQQNPQGSLW